MKAMRIGWAVALGLVLAGCAQPPGADIDAARHALDEARQAQAAEYAAQSWNAAQDAESKMQIELDTQEKRWSAVRTYTVARELAQDTKAAADRSRDEAVAGMELAKSEASTIMAQAREEAGRAHAAVDTLAEMQTAFDGGKYIDAKAKAQAAIEQAKGARKAA